MILDTQYRYPAKAYDANGKHTGPGRWLNLIHEANRICAHLGQPPMFDSPESSGDWWAGGYVEEYPDARVLHRDPGPDGAATNVSVIPKTDHGAAILADAAHNLDLMDRGERHRA